MVNKKHIYTIQQLLKLNRKRAAVKSKTQAKRQGAFTQREDESAVVQLGTETNELAEAIFLANVLVGCEPRNSKEDSSAPNSRETQFWTAVALRESTREHG